MVLRMGLVGMILFLFFPLIQKVRLIEQHNRIVKWFRNGVLFQMVLIKFVLQPIPLIELFSKRNHRGY